jgi:hypothetical protein
MQQTVDSVLTATEKFVSSEAVVVIISLSNTVYIFLRSLSWHSKSGPLLMMRTYHLASTIGRWSMLLPLDRVLCVLCMLADSLLLTGSPLFWIYSLATIFNCIWSIMLCTNLARCSWFVFLLVRSLLFVFYFFDKTRCLSTLICFSFFLDIVGTTQLLTILQKRIKSFNVVFSLLYCSLRIIVCNKIILL